MAHWSLRITYNILVRFHFLLGTPDAGRPRLPSEEAVGDASAASRFSVAIGSRAEAAKFVVVIVVVVVGRSAEADGAAEGEI